LGVESQMKLNWIFTAESNIWVKNHFFCSDFREKNHFIGVK
jgi:hypothetical protein